MDACTLSVGLFLVLSAYSCNRPFQDNIESPNLNDKYYMTLAGVRMEDVGQSSVWKLDSIENLRKEKLLKLELVKAKELAKIEAAKKLQEKLEKSKINPNDMFRGLVDLYSLFDEV